MKDHVPIPLATHESVMDLLGMKVRCYVLDDGRRIMNAEDVHEVLRKMAEPVTGSET